MLEHANEFHATMDTHSCRHCHDSLTRDLAQLDDLIAQIEKPPMSAIDDELARDFRKDRQPLLDGLALLNARLESTE